MKRKLITVFIIISYIITNVIFISGCGSGNKFFLPVPDSDLERAYYKDLYANMQDYIDIYTYMVINSTKKDDEEVDDEQYITGELKYNSWKTEKPDIIAYIEEIMPVYLKMLKSFSYTNGESHLENMKSVIESYVKALYLPDGAETPYESIISEEFSALNPVGLVREYLSQNSITIDSIEFKDNISKFEYHLYPYQVSYSFTLYYYTGNKTGKPKSIEKTLIFSISTDNKLNYLIDYVHEGTK